MTELIVALDEPSQMVEQCIQLSDAGVQWFKLNARSMMFPYRFHQVVGTISSRGLNLFLDLKLYDTRDTVWLAVAEAIDIGTKMLTVHADCVLDQVGEDRLKILAVGGLTDDPNPMKAGTSPAFAAGTICSVEYARFIRPHTDKLLVCPGIRPMGWPSDNHDRTAATPTAAREAGADFVVVGRPIYTATDPVGAATRIMRELAGTP